MGRVQETAPREVDLTLFYFEDGSKPGLSLTHRRLSYNVDNILHIIFRKRKKLKGTVLICFWTRNSTPTRLWWHLQRK